MLKFCRNHQRRRKNEKEQRFCPCCGIHSKFTKYTFSLAFNNDASKKIWVELYLNFIRWPAGLISENIYNGPVFYKAKLTSFCFVSSVKNVWPDHCPIYVNKWFRFPWSEMVLFCILLFFPRGLNISIFSADNLNIRNIGRAVWTNKFFLIVVRPLWKKSVLNFSIINFFLSL